MKTNESLSLNQRASRLTKAIQEMEILKASSNLIESYKQQLREVQEGIQSEILRVSSLIILKN